MEEELSQNEEGLDEESTSAEKQEGNRNYAHLKPWQFKKGQSGNPNGRPKGTVTLKEYARKYLRELTDEEKEEFMEGLPKEVVWKMAEGNPENTLGGNPDGAPIVIALSEYIAKKNGITNGPTSSPNTDSQ